MADTSTAAAPAAASAAAPAAAPVAPAAQPVSPAAPDPNKRYRVKLARAVEVVPGIWARPGHDVTLRGSDVVKIGAAIISYEEV